MAAHRQVRIKGKRGQWLAEVEGVPLPVVHHLDRVGKDRLDAVFDHRTPETSGQCAGLVAALQRETRLVLQKDRDHDSRARDGYIGVFDFDEFELRPDGFSLRLVRRYASPL